jgi:hypothetical protein
MSDVGRSPEIHTVAPTAVVGSCWRALHGITTQGTVPNGPVGVQRRWRGGTAI